MRFDEYRAHDAVGLAELVARGEVRAADLLEVALARCAEVDPVLNVLTRLMAGEARERVGGALDGPLAGVPFLVKDLMQDYAGLPTSGGTGPLRTVPAAEHSIVVRRWLAAGLVIFGKTTTPEYGCKAVTESRTFGITRNPWDLTRTPGGSSGGSAAAVAAGVVPVAGANDGGGSIRIPAACTGLFGLKPGRGLVPNGPLAGDAILGAGVQGVISRSVRDTAVMLDILSPPDPGAPYTVARPETSYRAALDTPPPALRIGFTHRSPLDTPVHPEAVRAVTETARLLESLGHTVESAEPAIDGVRLARDFMTVWTTHLAASVADTCERTGAKPTDFDVDTQTMAAVGRTVPAPALVTAGDRWNEYTRALADFHGRYDLLLTPTLAEPPQPIGTNRLPAALETILPPILRAGAGHLISRSSMYRGMVTSHLAATPFTQLANVTGRPAMSVPLHTTADGLPLGVHFTGPSGSEALLLRLAAQLETAAPWFDRHPPADPAR
ncbi:6-aminohexanoate-cyclic-dimer hydrolase [Nocardia farcinica]|uniref:amidase n=1 Tax=Nocardia farcinica TaxID=37329 RepID=A0A449G9M5_NOCFR|nr:amidase [Nocardia farcinica]SUE29660.1 putative 6-aminohexanoate-cyclic-dimer hydrolase [Nocardia farcinica]VFA95212.1 6-aminohexanoate-cyclic-dimer hydrolase [Nocardia farcinica]